MTVVKSFLHRQLFLLIVSIFVIVAGVRIVFPPFFNIGKLSPIKSFTEKELFNEFINDPIDAQSKYLNQVILLEGEIQGLERGMILMGTGMEVVRVKLNENWRYDIPAYHRGNQLVVKGVCRGIDLSEVVVSHSLIVTVR